MSDLSNVAENACLYFVTFVSTTVHLADGFAHHLCE